MKKGILNIAAVFPIISIVTLLQFCAPSASTSTSGVNYYEDLSVYRDDFEMPVFDIKDTVASNEVVTLPTQVDITPSEDIKAELDTVINRIIASRKDIKTVDGFTIQLYSGNNRDKANQVKARVSEASEILQAKISYDQPNYKVKTGEYYTRLEANPDLELLKKSFSRAVLVPNKIKIGE